MRCEEDGRLSMAYQESSNGRPEEKQKNSKGILTFFGAQNEKKRTNVKSRKQNSKGKNEHKREQTTYHSDKSTQIHKNAQGNFFRF